MNLPETDFWSVSGPRLHVLAEEATGSVARIVPPPGVAVVAHMDGANMADADGVFEQFWRELRFPDYFGWNWPALLDCLRDLQWLPADRYLVVIRNPGRLLSSAPEEREVFLQTLMWASDAWASPHGKPGGTGIPFNVLLFCGDAELDGIRHEVRRIQEN
ncbi:MULTISPECIES: barstar family protein [Streptomyces]|uniref:Barstar (barnase inhibitor) domain-containing protein n=1 Tax=Streptomyces luteosporeus TaxID=173856 RepID=A0ABP6G4L9_9ACTN